MRHVNVNVRFGFGFMDILEFRANVDLNALHYCSY